MERFQLGSAFNVLSLGTTYTVLFYVLSLGMGVLCAQIILLGKRRDPDIPEEEKELWLKPLLRTIKAIASNMRNTG